MKNEFICPLPMKWHTLHLALVNYWELQLNKIGPKPPTPLILAGWNFSEDWEKKIRWNETIEWAKVNNCEHLISIITDDEKYLG